MEFVKIEDMSVSTGQFDLQNVSLTLRQGEVLVVLGASGSGKSVFLESLAGFNSLRSGRIWLAGLDVTQVPPERRQIGFMFQDYALFPHLTVRDNINFSLRFRSQRSSQSGESPPPILPETIINLLHLERLLDRYPTQLSGGEKQRVAMARVLVQQPRLILLDEPMSALDARTREELREELGSLFKTLSLTAIYVTHDQTEALALADRVCILDAGRIVQFGTKDDIFNQPCNPFVAKFVGMENIFSGSIQSSQKMGNFYEHTVKVPDLGYLTVHSILDSPSYSLGDIITVGLRPEDILLEPVETRIEYNRDLNHLEENRLHATITTIAPWGVVHKLQFGGSPALKALATKQQVQRLQLEIGSMLQLFLPPSSLHIMPEARSK